MIEFLPGIVVRAGVCSLVDSVEHPGPLAFNNNINNNNLAFYVVFPLAAFNILNLFCIFGAFIVMIWKEFLFFAHPIWCSVSFLYLHRYLLLSVREIFFYDFLKIFSVPLT